MTSPVRSGCTERTRVIILLGDGLAPDDWSKVPINMGHSLSYPEVGEILAEAYAILEREKDTIE